jgi:histidyl-tRNA synthetase
MKLVHQCRRADIDCEIYPSNAKMQKQMKYANDRGVQFVALIGEEEMNKGVVNIKNMETGEQVAVKSEDIISYFKK